MLKFGFFFQFNGRGNRDRQTQISKSSVDDAFNFRC